MRQPNQRHRGRVHQPRCRPPSPRPPCSPALREWRAAEERLFGRSQQVVTPGDGRAHRVLALRHVGWTAGKDPRIASQDVAAWLPGEDPGPRRCQFNRQRQAVESRQISATAEALLSVSAKSGLTAFARSTKRRDASFMERSKGDSASVEGVSRGSTGKTCSPYKCRRSLLVIKHLRSRTRPGERRRAAQRGEDVRNCRESRAHAEWLETPAGGPQAVHPRPHGLRAPMRSTRRQGRDR